MLFAKERKLDMRYFGALVHPYMGNRTPLQLCIASGQPWAADNGCFNGFNPRKVTQLLHSLEDMPGCVFFNAPDSFDRVSMRGDAIETLQMFREWQPRIDAYGLPVAITLQNGVTSAMLRPVWDDLQAVFVGGATEFKYSDIVRDLVAEAKERGKWVHMGRVNSARRIVYAGAIECNSFDGTGFCKFPKTLDELSHFHCQSQRQSLLF